MRLRPYQSEAVSKTLEAFEESQSALVVMPTGCVSAETIIGVNRATKGYSRTISKEFMAQFDPRRIPGIATRVRALVGNRVGLHEAKSIVASGEKVTCELTLSNGRTLRATPDHDVLTESGWLALGDLREGQKVVCEQPPQAGRQRKAKPHYRMMQGLRFHPYAQGVTSSRRRGGNVEGWLARVPVHRLVAEASENGISVEELADLCRTTPSVAEQLTFLDPAVYAVHHIDGNHLNNATENLEVLTHTEHHIRHGQTDKLANLGYGLVEASAVKKVATYGLEPTFDIVCADPHRNFVANGIVVHNCGKTVVFSKVIDARRCGRYMVIAHREELIRQAQAKIEAVTGERPEIEMAEERADEGGLLGRTRGVVASVQTLINRVKRFDPREFTTIIIDEAHHATAKSYRKAIKHFTAGNPAVKILGVTATPDRADEEALGQIFDAVAFNYEIHDAVRDGWLVPVRQRIVQVNSLDFADIKTTAGDFNQGQLAAVMEDEENLHKVASPVADFCGAKKTLIFATTVAQAERMAEILNRHDEGSARWVCGETPKDVRAQMFRDFRDGAFNRLCNVGVATEGYDEPGIECVVIARPTKSRSLYAQMVGRGTRVHPDAGIDQAGPDATGDDRRSLIAFSCKPHVEVLDFAGNAGRHKLVSCADILGGKYTDEVVALAEKKIAESAGMDVETALAEAAAEAKQRHEDARRREMEARRRVVSVADYSMQEVDPFDVLQIEPERLYGWDRVKRPSDRMVSMLASQGIDASRMKFAEASKLIGEILTRRERGLCSYAMAKALSRAGYPTDVSPSEATKMLVEIARKKREGVVA